MHRIPISKGVLFLTSEEIHQTLLKNNPELLRVALSRGKAIKRSESKKAQYEKKLAQMEAAFLNNLID